MVGWSARRHACLCLCVSATILQTAVFFNEHVAVYHPSINSDWQRSQRKNTSWQTHQTKNADPNSVPANSSWKANSWARFLQLWPSSLRLLRVETNSLNCTSHYIIGTQIPWNWKNPKTSQEQLKFFSSHLKVGGPYLQMKGLWEPYFTNP